MIDPVGSALPMPPLFDKSTRAEVTRFRVSLSEFVGMCRGSVPLDTLLDEFAKKVVELFRLSLAVKQTGVVSLRKTAEDVEEILSHLSTKGPQGEVLVLEAAKAHEENRDSCALIQIIQKLSSNALAFDRMLDELVLHAEALNA